MFIAQDTIKGQLYYFNDLLFSLQIVPLEYIIHAYLKCTNLKYLAVLAL